MIDLCNGHHFNNEEFLDTIRARADEKVHSRMHGIIIMCGISAVFMLDKNY